MVSREEGSNNTPNPWGVLGGLNLGTGDLDVVNNLKSFSFKGRVAGVRGDRETDGAGGNKAVMGRDGSGVDERSVRVGADKKQDAGAPEEAVSDKPIEAGGVWVVSLRGSRRGREVGSKGGLAQGRGGSKKVKNLRFLT